MAPVPLVPQVRYLPVAAAVGHGLTVATLTIAVARSLYRSAGHQPPSQGTRGRSRQRSILSPLFAVLAIISLVLAVRSTLSHGILSYKVWADQRDIEVPSKGYGENGLFPGSGNSTGVQLHLAQWLTDTPVYTDGFEIIFENARRFWWTQQVELATISWGLLLSIEGRRRNIPLVWAYLVLAHLVSLSFAQNLFYLAMLLTPVPIPSDGKSGVLPASHHLLARLHNRVLPPPKPANWQLHPALVGLLLTQSFGVLIVAPFVTGTESFVQLLVVGRALPFAPLVLSAVVPVSWGRVHPHPHDAYDAVSELFRFASMMSFVLQTKSLALGLLHDTADAHRHRHSGKFLHTPFESPKAGVKTLLKRTSTSLTGLLGSALDHPAVAASAQDVVMCGLSLTLWAATRRLDVNDMLTSSNPFFTNTNQGLGNSSDGAPVGDDSPEPEVNVEYQTPSARRRAGSSIGDTVNPPSVGISAKKPTGRSRKKKTKASRDYRAEADSAYMPTASTADDATAAEGDEAPVPEDEPDWEAAALAWGLGVLGGLGVGAAGVFGAECVAT